MLKTKKILIFLLINIVIFNVTVAVNAETLNIKNNIHNKIIYKFYYSILNSWITNDKNIVLTDNIKKTIINKIIYTGLQEQINPCLIYRIIKIESNFNQFAISNKNAKGLMQLRDIAIKDIIGQKTQKNINVYDIKTNIDIGVKFLKKMLKKANNNLPVALSFYNQGIRTITKKINKGLPVKKIIRNNYVRKILNPNKRDIKENI